ncbi:uncharacterized protein LOC120647293 [Panicum virgatum]|uniref:uncharacterized protein LOC120647293 n=1 Tax=Panicum virgatum TaxID=38727 RepID=UPI0019D632E6|nr:uncharacterized protein LOC120647293 [Panicum virgatum]
MDPSQMMFPMWGAPPPPPAAMPPPSDDPAVAPNAQPFLPPPNRGWKRKNPAAAAYQPPALGDLQVQNRAKARRWFKKSNNSNPNTARKYFFPKNKNKAAAPRNTTSFIIRAKRAGGIASLVSPCPVTPAVLPTPRLSPSREGLADMAQAQWGVDGYGSMKGLIRLRSSPQPANPNAAASDDDDDGNSSGSDVEEHVEMERRLDHDLSRFEMVYPGRGEDAGGGYVFEDDDEYDQDAHVSRLEEENLTLKERLFLMEQEVGDMRRRLEVLEARFSQCDGVAGGENAVEEAPPGNDAERVHGVSENSSEGDAEGVHLGSDKSEGQTAAMQAPVVSVNTGEHDAVGSEEAGKHNVKEQVAVGSEEAGKHNVKEQVAVGSKKAGETDAEEQGALGGSEKTSKHDAEKQGVLDEHEMEMTDSEKIGEHDIEMVDSALDKKMGEDNGEIRLEPWQ